MENLQVISRDNQVRFMEILAYMHPGVVEGMLDGTLFWRVSTDVDLRNAIEVEQTPTEYPRHYIQAIVGAPTMLIANGTSATEAGPALAQQGVKSKILPMAVVCR